MQLCRAMPAALVSLMCLLGADADVCRGQGGFSLSMGEDWEHYRAAGAGGIDLAEPKLALGTAFVGAEPSAGERFAAADASERPLPDHAELSFSMSAPPDAPQPADGEPAPHAGGVQNDANNPLTPKITINFHNYYIPSFYGPSNRDSNQFLLRGIIPHKIGGAPQLFRFTLPVANVPTYPDGRDTGLGDLVLINYFAFKEGGLEFGVGPVLVAPTAGSEALGAGKWQAGASALAVAPQKWGLLGGVLTFQQSFASQGGDSGRDEVTLLQFQPLAIYNLPHGFYLRSTAIWNFDLHNETYYMPVGMGAGLVHQTGRLTINAFVEPQFTLVYKGVAPQWQIFAGINFQIAF